MPYNKTPKQQAENVLMEWKQMLMGNVGWLYVR